MSTPFFSVAKAPALLGPIAPNADAQPVISALKKPSATNYQETCIDIILYKEYILNVK